MPIAEFMNGFRTDPETRRLMGLAFELTRVTLRLSARGLAGYHQNRSFDQFVRKYEQPRRHLQAECLGGFEIDQ